ncbi:DUF3459 domain-containing protein, partial [Mycobacterium sp.]|uniref:DUF3459 domain-containing protein n=1 Tax=Mycobacterium sp. TaxID=1785 RepID=UPI002C6166D3
HGWDADEIPDPQDPATFERSKLNWDEIDDGDHGRLRRTYQQLIALRHNEPDMADACLDHLRVEYDEAQRWIVMYRGSLSIACNLNSDAVVVPATGEVVLAWREPVVGVTTTQLQAHSFVILRP